MAIPTDTLLPSQWHLRNPVAGLLDLNVFPVWNDYTGRGVRVVVIDDGFDYTHPDLSKNYDAAHDRDFETHTTDAFGNPTDLHGTMVAGVIAADDNGTGVVGVAFDASLVGYRYDTTGTNDEFLESIAYAYSFASFDVFGDVVSVSLGISTDPTAVFGKTYTKEFFNHIYSGLFTDVASGGGGLGTTVVKSANNARKINADINTDPWTQHTEQVVVAAVDQNGFVSEYSSYGAPLLISAFGSPGGANGEVVTTDRRGADGKPGDFTDGFNGTSAATPMVAGVVALMYQANPGLGWRDVQTILAHSARHVGSPINGTIAGNEKFPWGWNGAKTWNGGGLHFSNDYGYGLIDARAAVRLAETWLLSDTAQTDANQIGTQTIGPTSLTTIPDNNAAGATFNITECVELEVERVFLSVNFNIVWHIGDLRIFLTSPSGTTSTLLFEPMKGQVEENSVLQGPWTFESQAFRGELSKGTWQVRNADSGACVA